MGRGLVRQRWSRSARREQRAQHDGLRRAWRSGSVDGRVVAQSRESDRVVLTMWVALAAAVALFAGGCSMTEDAPEDDIYSGY